VTLDALKPFACEAPKQVEFSLSLYSCIWCILLFCEKLISFMLQEPEPLPYLAEKNHINYDIPLEVRSCHIVVLSFYLIEFLLE
jgi:fumarylacetoacetase